MNNTVGLIGSGNVASSIVGGLVKRFPSMNKNIFVSDRASSKTDSLRNTFNVNVSASNFDLVKSCDIVLLCVKPNVLPAVLKEIKDFVTNSHLIISVAAGITTDFIQSFFPNPVKIIRTMPNIAVSVGEGMTAICPNPLVSEKELEYAIQIFGSVGKVDVIEEDHLDTVTSISGSSPGFISVFIEALADGAVLQGMPRDKAYKYAAQAMLGTAKIILEKGLHPAEVKDMVCSPGGTTIEAVYSMEKNNFRSVVIETMNVCTMKAKALAKNDK